VKLDRILHSVLGLSFFGGWSLSPSQPGAAGVSRRPAASAGAQTGARHPVTLATGDWSDVTPGGVLALTGLAVLLGIFLVAQWDRTTANPASRSDPSPGVTQATIARLQDEQTLLQEDLTTLRAQASPSVDPAVQAPTSAAAMAALTASLANQQALAGTVPLRGTGLEITLDDSAVKVLPPGADPENYLIHEYQIRDVVNLLWGSGAAGIAVNGERFVSSTSTYCVGSTILINDTRTSPPYHVVAVGDVARMQAALADGQSLSDLKARSREYGVVLRLGKVGTYTLPAFEGTIDVSHTALASAGSGRN
jgi:uncharacterized protein YlxW (UPF0749 family)